MTALSWLRKIRAELPELNTIPLFGNAPPFDWSLFSSSLAAHLEYPNIQIHPKNQGWQNGAHIKKGLGAEAHILPIVIHPIGTVYWMMSKEDRNKLTCALVRAGSKSRASLSEVFQEGFYRFFSLQSISVISEAPPFTGLTLQIGSEEEECEKAFCIDVQIDLEEKSCWGRLVLPQEFHSKWIEHFSEMSSDYVPQEIAKQTLLDLSLKTGSFVLDQEKWETLEKGDFVLLNEGSYDAHKGTGSCLLMLNATPIFNAKLKQGKVELIDYAFYYEDNMENQSEGGIVAIKEVPLDVTIEIARLKMTLDQLMHLTPGNTLDLPIHPDQGVNLTVNGQIVGRAELVHLGEQLGIRILEI